MTDIIIQTRRTRLTHWLFFMLLGVLLGGLVVVQAAPVQVVDERMEVACAMPKLDGEMTVVTVINGKVICWRWQ